LKRGDGGGQVKLVQEWLSLHDERVAIDGDFGPATEAAVQAFQGRVSLPATGVVDQSTFSHLIAPMVKALQALPVAGRSLGELVVAYARQHLDQHPVEVGGQNKGPWVRLYMDGHEGDAWPWCAGFACFCLKQACGSLGRNLPVAPSFSVDELAASAKSKGCFVGREEIGPGGLFLVRSTPTDWTHTGIVVATDTELFRTIEGNTNDDGSREGYEVCARRRGYQKMDFIKI
jgi:hypothetical protein